MTVLPIRSHLVIERIPRTIRITELRLRPLGDVAAHRPGQYVLVGPPQAASAAPAEPLVVDLRERSGRADVAPPRVLRPYAIANAPRPDRELSLLVTRVPGGDVSTWLH